MGTVLILSGIQAVINGMKTEIYVSTIAAVPNPIDDIEVTVP